MEELPAPVVTGFLLAVGACVGMVVFGVVKYVAQYIGIILLAAYSRFFGKAKPFVNGKGERVTPNGGAK
jgi:hypothetical protein